MEIGGMDGCGMVLLIEENEANSRLATAVLEREGFQVEVATSAAEAKKLLRLVTPAVIVMDTQLPGQDCFTCTHELKASASTLRIPIVDLSSPIDTQTFAAQVRRVLDDAQGFAAETRVAS
jgi:two-component system, sensor histidine kinase and response regulator